MVRGLVFQGLPRKVQLVERGTTLKSSIRANIAKRACSAAAAENVKNSKSMGLTKSVAHSGLANLACAALHFLNQEMWVFACPS